MNTQPIGYKAKAFEARNLAFFFLLAFGLTWLKNALTVAFDLKMPTSLTDPVVLFVVFVGFPGGIGPTFAAFVVTAITEGKPGVKALWKRFWNRNASLKWLLVALLFYDTLRLTTILIARALEHQAYQILELPDPLWSYIPALLTPFIISGMGEEFGWRGYVLPRFQAKWNALTSGLLLGVTWASWHIPFFFIPGGGLYQRNFLEWALWLVLSSVVYTWLFNNTKGSVLVTALFHATANYSMFSFPTQASAWTNNLLLLLAVTLIVIVFGAKNLVRQRAENDSPAREMTTTSLKVP
jgi:membrane protease YdiL (CAAX protease family)